MPKKKIKRNLKVKRKKKVNRKNWDNLIILYSPFNDKLHIYTCEDVDCILNISNKHSICTYGILTITKKSLKTELKYVSKILKASKFIKENSNAKEKCKKKK